MRVNFMCRTHPLMVMSVLKIRLSISHVQKDPAIEKFGWIRENTDRFFKFKPRSVRNAVIWALLIPGAMLYFIKKTPVCQLSILT